MGITYLVIYSWPAIVLTKICIAHKVHMSEEQFIIRLSLPHIPQLRVRD